MRILILSLLFMSVAHAQPPIEPGVSQELARWRAAHYSDVRYKLNLTLEKMSPVLKGTIEIRVVVRDAVSGGREDATTQSVPPALAGGAAPGVTTTPIILDWRRTRGFEALSQTSNVSINGRKSIGLETNSNYLYGVDENLTHLDDYEHLVFRNGVVPGENVIKLDFTSPILPSGSAITRYVDKEDGSEYIYSLFVPSDASTAFPVFDQPDLKARFDLGITAPASWKVVSNTLTISTISGKNPLPDSALCPISGCPPGFVRPEHNNIFSFETTKPISTYVFAFAAGPWALVSPPSSSGSQQSVPPAVAGGPDVLGKNPPATAGGTDSGVDKSRPTSGSPTGSEGVSANPQSAIPDPQSARPPATAGGTDLSSHVFVRKSQLAKFQPHAAEVFRLNREGIKFLEEYFDYKFPFPKYDIVLIPEFPFGGMEHAGATFLRESSVIFPSEPTANDHISRANVIFHEAAHQWFGDTVTMKWFDDLWLKEGFAEFMAYKTLERVMPQYNAWKAFYERNKPLAYATDSTRGTTPIYQEIKNLNSAKSAYGNIVYRKAPSFLKQAEFFLGPDKFQTAVRAFLKKHEYGNAGWEDLVVEFQVVGRRPLTDTLGMKQADLDLYERAEKIRIQNFALLWVKLPGVSELRNSTEDLKQIEFNQSYAPGTQRICLPMKFEYLVRLRTGNSETKEAEFDCTGQEQRYRGYYSGNGSSIELVFPNYEDYGYGIFLLDTKSRDYVLKNIQNEKDDFLRSMMWGALWDSVREGELDPKEYVELAIKVLSPAFRRPNSITLSAARSAEKPPKGGTQNDLKNSPESGTQNEDESTTSAILARVSTAMVYYRSVPSAVAGGTDLSTRLESMLIENMRTAPTLGLRITYYRAFLNIVSSENGRSVLKGMLRQQSAPPATAGATDSHPPLPLKTKDRFDIVTKLASLNDPDAEKLLTELEKTETNDDAKRYAYAARAAFPTKETKEKYWTDFTTGKDISESWIEAAFGPFNSVRHADLTLPYLERALKELPNHKRNRKIFFVNGWLAAFIGGQKSEEALAIVNRFLADNPNLDRDLRLKILENVDVIERAVKIRGKFAR